MLLSPFIVGVLSAQSWRWVVITLALFWLCGYFAFYATSVWLKSRRMSRHANAVRVYVGVASVLGALTVWQAPGLAWWAPAFVAPLMLGLWAASRRRERDLLNGLVTVAGSSLMTVVAHEAAGGQDPARAWKLAAVQLLYFAGTVFYVKSAIRERNNAGFLRLSVGMHVAAAAAVLVLSPWLALVFCALATRAAVLPRKRLSPKVIGVWEVVATIVVAMTSLATV